MWADGYVPRLISDTFEHLLNPVALPIIFARLDGAVVPIERVGSNSDPAYIAALERLALSMDFAYGGARCEWREVPRMLVALNRAKNELAGAERLCFLRPVEHVVVRDFCDDPREFFREYLP